MQVFRCVYNSGGLYACSGNYLLRIIVSHADGETDGLHYVVRTWKLR